MSQPNPTRLVFVCMGNICRSPTAEAVFLHLARERGQLDGMQVESAGTDAWHVGEPPDARSAEAAAQHGVTLAGSAQQLTRRDQQRFDLFVCMDRDNAAGVHALGVDPERIVLLRDFDADADGPDVPDPYYGGEDGFERVFRIIHAGCAGLLDHLAAP